MKVINLIDRKVDALNELFTWPYIMIFIRLIPTLIIFKWNILRSFLFMFLDGIDYFFFKSYSGSFSESTYHSLDKIFDQYYFTVQLIVILKQWDSGPFKKTSIYMYLYRLLGFVLFEITKLRYLLVIFTNIFEYFFDVILLCEKIFVKFKNNWKNTFLITLLLIPFKLFQELYVHTDINLPSVEYPLLRIIGSIFGFIIVIYLQFFYKKPKNSDLEIEKSQ